jgi:predicted dithiol-disulfide oxidoreductase (DUF899 family)
MTRHEIVSEAQWIEAWRALLAEEKAWTRERDRLSQKRRALPWVKVEKNYVFEGVDGPVTLAELFDGRSQLVVYHFMFGPASLCLARCRPPRAKRDQERQPHRLGEAS